VPNSGNNTNGGKQPSPLARVMLMVLAAFFGFMLFQTLFGAGPGGSGDINYLSYSSFIEQVEKDNVAQVEVSEDKKLIRIELKKPIPVDAGQTSTGRSDSGKASPRVSGLFTVYLAADYDTWLTEKLLKHGVRVEALPKKGDSVWGFFGSWIPMLLFLGVWIFFMRRAQGGAGGALQFGKSKYRIVQAKDMKKFSDVAGCDESKEELKEIVDFLRDPRKFYRLGGKIPKGVLLVGQPGTGKTLLAKAIAGEANVPFFSISGSDFVEMFVGVGASRVRDLFEQGKKHAPCIIFMDEIDAVGRHRGAGLGGGHDEREQTLNQLLVEMDGFDSNEGVILIAATNRPDVLDPALLRPGRFDRQIVVPRPDLKGREEILKIHSREKPMHEDVDLSVVARGTPGFSGADLANLVNEAALLASRRDKEKIEPVDFEDAKDKVLMGPERKSAVIPEHERLITAYHEAGHAIVAQFLFDTDVSNADPVHKVTIIPRGMAGGLTQQLPLEDRHNYSEQYVKNRLAVLLAGRAGEERQFGGMKSTGAGNDIEVATKLSRKMICEWGMSEKLGPVVYGQKEELVFLGRDVGHRQNYSEETARLVDEEIKENVVVAHKRAHEILETNTAAFEALAQTLLRIETVTGNEVAEIYRMNS